MVYLKRIAVLLRGCKMFVSFFFKKESCDCVWVNASTALGQYYGEQIRRQ